jgi:rubrerythrin
LEDEVVDVLNAAIYKEIAAEALYQAVQNRTSDPGAAALMKEMADEEKRHAEWITNLRDKGNGRSWHRGRVADLKIADHLVGADRLEGAGLQDTLIFSVKREQQSVEFYSKMMGMMRTAKAKRLCQTLANEEMRHKLKLEMLYDRLFLGED